MPTIKGGIKLGKHMTDDDRKKLKNALGDKMPFNFTKPKPESKKKLKPIKKKPIVKKIINKIVKKKSSKRRKK